MRTREGVLLVCVDTAPNNERQAADRRRAAGWTAGCRRRVSTEGSPEWSERESRQQSRHETAARVRAWSHTLRPHAVRTSLAATAMSAVVI